MTSLRAVDVHDEPTKGFRRPAGAFEHHLYEKAIDHKLFQHPRAGSLALDRHVLELPGSEGHRIWAFHPADAATSNALLRLASPEAVEPTT